MVAVWVILPDVPVILTEADPVSAKGMAVNSSLLVVAVLRGVKGAMTPFGKSGMVSLTLLSKPFTAVIVMVLVVPALWLRNAFGGAEIVKPGWARR